jgi:S-adenosylmethionine synthetase
MTKSLFTSESVSKGHPDKVADQISDAILDAYLAQDPESRVACETLVTTGQVIVAGEVTSRGIIDVQEVVRDTIRRIGYTTHGIGFEAESVGILVALHRQSPDIAQGVNEGQGLHSEQGAGDQGIMFGYATDETPRFLPLPIHLAHRLVEELTRLREEGILSYLRPDAKSQVTVEYDGDEAKRIHTVVLSTQHDRGVELETIRRDLVPLATALIDKESRARVDEHTIWHINPTGRFEIGGPHGDTGVTGRKIIVDTYGGIGRHGGGAFSGKDPSKVDRSAAYAARWVAKHLIAAKLAKRAELQLAYAIGVARPVSIKVDTFGTGAVSEAVLAEAIGEVFDLRPKGIIAALDLRKPIYRETAFHGHFGRPEFAWERVDRVDALLAAVSRRQGASTAAAE